MDDELYKIAKQNLKYKRQALWFVSIGGAIFLGSMIWLIKAYEQVLPWVVFGLGITLMGYAIYLETKVINKKRDPILEEMKRLEKAGFTSDDVEELELKQIVKRYKDDDFV